MITGARSMILKSGGQDYQELSHWFLNAVITFLVIILPTERIILDDLAVCNVFFIPYRDCSSCRRPPHRNPARSRPSARLRAAMVPVPLPTPAWRPRRFQWRRSTPTAKASGGGKSSLIACDSRPEPRAWDSPAFRFAIILLVIPTGPAPRLSTPRDHPAPSASTPHRQGQRQCAQYQRHDEEPSAVNAPVRVVDGLAVFDVKPHRPQIAHENGQPRQHYRQPKPAPAWQAAAKKRNRTDRQAEQPQDGSDCKQAVDRRHR